LTGCLLVYWSVRKLESGRSPPPHFFVWNYFKLNKPSVFNNIYAHVICARRILQIVCSEIQCSLVKTIEVEVPQTGTVLDIEEELFCKN
jgi:hypothetical protein